MTVDLQANRKRLNEIFWSFCIINGTWRLTLRHVLTKPLELIFGANSLHLL